MELQGPYYGKIATGGNVWGSGTISGASLNTSSVDPKVEPVGPLKHLLYRLEQAAITLEIETGKYHSVLLNFKPADSDNEAPLNCPVENTKLSEMGFYDRLELVALRLEKSIEYIGKHNNEFKKLL